MVDGCRNNAIMARALVDDLQPTETERAQLEFGLAVYFTKRLRWLEAAHAAPRLVELDEVLEEPAELQLPSAAQRAPTGPPRALDGGADRGASTHRGARPSTLRTRDHCMSRSVAVLGAGIMGSSTALHLARRGVAVTLFDAASEPFTGASRWNEGKIHLGFLYAADPTLRTARAVLPGGLDFKHQVEQLTGMSLDAATTTGDDHYLVHRDSVVDATAVGGYLDAVAALVASSPAADRYLVDVSDCRVHRLGPADLEAVADPTCVVAGYRVPERSVDTTVVADAFIDALRSQTGIAMAMEQRVDSVQPATDRASSGSCAQLVDGTDRSTRW